MVYLLAFVVTVVVLMFALIGLLMQRRRVAAMTTCVVIVGLLSLPFAALALTKSLTLAAPATYKAPGFKSATLLYSPEGDQTCLVVSACARDATTGLEGDCREHRVCTSSPPASITTLLAFAVSQWTTAAGY